CRSGMRHQIDCNERPEEHTVGCQKHPHRDFAVVQPGCGWMLDYMVRGHPALPSSERARCALQPLNNSLKALGVVSLANCRLERPSPEPNQGHGQTNEGHRPGEDESSEDKRDAQCRNEWPVGCVR